MPGSRPSGSEVDRVSTVAALTALGGHAAIISAALLLSGKSQTVVVAPGVVSVTLVSSAPAGGAPSPPAAPAAASTASSPSPIALAPEAPAGDRLDRLIAPDAAAPASTPPAPAARRSSAADPRGSGSSQIDQGLGQGEGAEGIDLYAAASLPNVGARPVSPPTGDLWERVAPCWRSAGSRRATLMVEIGDDGRLSGSPRAVRKISAPADPQLLLAERAGARALQACAPYGGLGGRAWRVTFP
jgi:hypothetical protein